MKSKLNFVWLFGTINSLIIVILGNIIFSFIHPQLDLTKNKIHSLSPITKKIVSQLDDVVEIKAFVSEQLPLQLSSLKDNLLLFLNNYQNLSGHKIKVTVLDPNKNEQAKQEANRIGLGPIQFSTIENDKFQVSQGYFAVAIAYQDKSEVIPTLENFANLEYYLTSTIKKVTSEKLKTIAFAAGHQENSPSQLEIATKIISQSYQWQIVDLGDKNATFNKNIDLLIINNPKEKFLERSKLVLDQIIQSGKGVILLIDKINVDNSLIPNKSDNNLNDLLTYYGFKIKDSLILDPSAVIASFRDQTGNSFITAYPFWVKILQNRINKEFTPLAGINTLIFNWVSPIELEKNAIWLVKTTPYSWEEKNPILLPNRDFGKEKIENQGEKIIVGFQNQKMASFFADKNPNNLIKQIGEDGLISNQNQLKMVVVSDADFINDESISNNQENLVFFMNLVDFLTQEEDLNQIRSKTLALYPINIPQDKQKQLIKIINLTAPLFVSFIAYFLVFLIRKKIILQEKF